MSRWSEPNIPLAVRMVHRKASLQARSMGVGRSDDRGEGSVTTKGVKVRSSADGLGEQGRASELGER